MIPNSKKSFALFITLFLVVLFGILSYKIVENNVFSSNLNKLKYLHLQANIYLEYIKSLSTNKLDIIILNDDGKVDLGDTRYKCFIYSKDQNGTTIYYFSLETVDDTHIRLSGKL